MNYFKTLSILAISAITFTSCDESENIADLSNTTGELAINFDAVVGEEDFALNTPFTIDGQDYEFNKLRYWVSDVQLIDEEGSTLSIPNSYYLLEETNEISVQDGAYTYPAKKREVVEFPAIPAKTYTKLIFSIGVDETHNDNMSLQSGELSQLNGMTNISWMWHTSYIFSSLSGVNVTDAENTVNVSVETGLNANYRIVEIELATPIEITDNNLSELNLKVDVLEMINGIDLEENPRVSASTPELMSQVADNYKNNVFTVIAE